MGEDPIKAALGAGGALAQVLPSYEPRAPQIEMAHEVMGALKEGRALVVEAGTGTGKTLAYLLPAALCGHKVVISTGTKALQEQLADKDVPLLQSLGVKARFAFLKGRQNYLCLLRKEQFESQPLFTAREEEAHWNEIRAWAERTAFGEKSEVEGVPEQSPLWRELTSTAESCTGQKCQLYDSCYVFKARQRASQADVVIVNHHLFFADLRIRRSSAGDTGSAVLPAYTAVIFDEAHGVEETATDHFGAMLSSHRVAELARDAQRTLASREAVHALGLAQRLQRDGSAYFAKAAQCRPADARPLPEPRKRKHLLPELEDARWTIAPGSLAPAEPERKALQEIVRALGAELSRGKKDEELQLLERRCSELHAELELFAADAHAEEPASPATGGARRRGASNDETQVRWAELRSGHLFLHSSPVDVASLMQTMLYEHIGPVIFTSATLAVGNSLDYFEQRVGLRDSEGPLYPTNEAVLPSPFDYQKNAALYLPEQMPEPIDPSFPEAVADELRKLLPITGGRAFALFTSLKNMRAVHALLKDELPYQVLLQGERPKSKLLSAFKSEPSVLFASQSFWEGVDVQGDALSMVVIDKLPFASPGEPLVSARIERINAAGGNAFGQYQVPQAALALKQGFGRLIRSSRDRGIVAVLDRRVTQKSYGRLFLNTLPKCRIARSVHEVQQFWNSPQR